MSMDPELKDYVIFLHIDGKRTKVKELKNYTSLELLKEIEELYLYMFAELDRSMGSDAASKKDFSYEVVEVTYEKKY